MGRVTSPRLTCTSTFGPVRSKAGLSADICADTANIPKKSSGKQRRIFLLYGDRGSKQALSCDNPAPIRVYTCERENIMSRSHFHALARLLSFTLPRG